MEQTHLDAGDVALDDVVDLTIEADRIANQLQATGEDDLAALVGQMADVTGDLTDAVRAQRTVIADLQDLTQRPVDDVDDAEPTTIEQFARLNDASLGATDHRASVIFANFGDWVNWTADGQPAILTRTSRGQPSQFKRQLEAAVDDTLAWNEVYRALEQVACLSGGDPDDPTDGAFVFYRDYRDPGLPVESTKALALQRPFLLETGRSGFRKEILPEHYPVGSHHGGDN